MALAATAARATDIPLRAAPSATFPANLPWSNFAGGSPGVEGGAEWHRSGELATAAGYPAINGSPGQSFSSGRGPCKFGDRGEGRAQGGVDAGYNWQFGSLATGVEADAYVRAGEAARPAGGAALQSAPAPAGPAVFASAMEPGDMAKPGDFIRTIRPFGSWTPVCDEAIPKRRRVCFLEQAMEGGDGAMFVWQISGTVDGRVMMIVKGPGDLYGPAGIKMSFYDFEQTVTDPVCTASAGCVMILPFQGMISEWVAREPNIDFPVVRNGIAVPFSGAMDGFKEALAVVAKPDTAVPGAAGEPQKALAANRRARARTVARRMAPKAARVADAAAPVPAAEPAVAGDR